MPFDEHTFFLVWALGVLVTWPIWFWAVVRSRRGRGEPLVPRRPADALFWEGRSDGHARGRLGGASRALFVAVTPQELVIGPAFPFSMIMPYGAFGLDHRVTKNSVRADARRTWRGELVDLEWERPKDGRTIKLELRMKQPAAFLKALRS